VKVDADATGAPVAPGTSTQLIKVTVATTIQAGTVIMFK
jgi:hypothetical protein